MKDNVPPEKRYLYNYFYTDIQKMFLRYYLIFGDHKNFTDHTGKHVGYRWRAHLANRIRFLEAAKTKAKKTFDLTLLSSIESGDCNPDEMCDPADRRRRGRPKQPK